MAANSAPLSLARRAAGDRDIALMASLIEAPLVWRAIARSEVPVLASRIDGNVGLLGPAYEGYFAPGDAAELATLMQRFHKLQAEALAQQRPAG